MHHVEISDRAAEITGSYPGYQRLFSRAVGIFGVGRLKAEATNRARKVSGTQSKSSNRKRASRPFHAQLKTRRKFVQRNNSSIS